MELYSLYPMFLVEPLKVRPAEANSVMKHRITSTCGRLDIQDRVGI
jgi:hypothetical protein